MPPLSVSQAGTMNSTIHRSRRKERHTPAMLASLRQTEHLDDVHGLSAGSLRRVTETRLCAGYRSLRRDLLRTGQC